MMAHGPMRKNSPNRNVKDLFPVLTPNHTKSKRMNGQNWTLEEVYQPRPLLPKTNTDGESSKQEAIRIQ